MRHTCVDERIGHKLFAKACSARLFEFGAWCLVLGAKMPVSFFLFPVSV